MEAPFEVIGKAQRSKVQSALSIAALTCKTPPGWRIVNCVSSDGRWSQHDWVNTDWPDAIGKGGKE